MKAKTRLASRPFRNGTMDAETQVDLVPNMTAVSHDRWTAVDHLSGGSWWASVALTLTLALAASVPTAGDAGLTWDEPAYRFSQLRSAQWWNRVITARSMGDLNAVLAPDALLFYWPYARHGINFHPPLAGQLSALAHAVFGQWMQDTPSRRMASVIEFSLTIAIGFGFLARRYGVWVAGIMAGSLLMMPRVYGDAHLATTDVPGLLIWAAAALTFWKGLHESNARRWRVLVGVLIGLGFVEKMGTVFVLGPILLWMVVARLPPTFSRSRPGGLADWTDGLITSGAMLAPLVVALLEIVRLTRLFPQPKYTDLFDHPPTSSLPGAILAAPLLVWGVRRLLGRVFRSSALWGRERPALETFTAVLAFGPVVGWLGNPAWWRETLPRLAHYYMLNTDRRGSLPDIRIFYLGETYFFSLPWHNAWVLIAVTVPVAVLLASAAGVFCAFRDARRDRLPLYLVLHFVAIPVVRMFPTPAHDGVRLMLPSFFFLAALSGLGAVRLADGLSRLVRARTLFIARLVVAAVVLGTSAWQLIQIHPYELSYYNERIGGPRGAWRSGRFELTYWYDAFNSQALDELNRTLPRGAEVDFLNPNTQPSTFHELQTLGHLRPDLVLGWSRTDRFPFVWLLTQDSKATSFTRLLYAMEPWYALRPRQLDGLRVATVADPAAVSRAWALWLLADAGSDRPRPVRKAPGWVHRSAPILGRLWVEGLPQPRLTAINEALFSWAKSDPDGLLAASRRLGSRRGSDAGPDSRRLRTMLERQHSPRAVKTLLDARPEALVEAVLIVIERPDSVRAVLGREAYTDTDAIGGALDRNLYEGRGGALSGKAPRE